MATGKISVGMKVGKLTVVERTGTFQHGKAVWFCKCDCGGSREVSARNLIRNPNISCGCDQWRSRSPRKREKHGMRYTKEYRIWMAMISRCHNENYPKYEDYGGKGIHVCPEWRNSFERFIEYIGPMPHPDLTIDRIENSKGYEPGNVRWATRLVQRINQDRTVVIEFRGLSLPLLTIGQMLGLAKSVVHNRIYRSGWTIEEALSTPLGYARGIYDLPLDVLKQMNDEYTASGCKAVKRKLENTEPSMNLSYI